MYYDDYNREERSLCSHLFRLLHEKLADQPQASALNRFMGLLAKKIDAIKLDKLRYTNIGIYTEVALIRDAYFVRKDNVDSFMNGLTKLIMAQEGVTDCRLYSELPTELCNPRLTHPKQIRQKAKERGVHLTPDENRVYGTMQAMFNAKPDLVITIDNLLITFEAKFTQKFDDEQLSRTQNITHIWASELLFSDLGFTSPPKTILAKIGASGYSPDITWDDVFEIQQHFFGPNDRSYIAFQSASRLLKDRFAEKRSHDNQNNHQ